MAKDDAPHSLMSPAEMKPLLMLSKRDPVSAVIGLTKSKDGVVFLAKKVKPRKLVAQMKKHAAEAKMELDVASLRFGRATVDAEADSSLVTFTVNKEAAGTMRPKLLVHLKKAGFGKCEIVVDASLETESDEDELHAPGMAPPGGHPDPAGMSADAPAGEAAEAGTSSPPSAAAPTAANEAAGAQHPAVAPADATPASAGDAPALDRAALTQRITDLVKRMMDAMAANPAGADAMRTAALSAQAGLKSGDLGAAAASADALERLLGGTPGSPPAAGPAGARPAHSAVFDKAQAAWIATRQRVQGEFDKLFAEISNVYDGHDIVGELEKTFHARVSPTMGQLDQSLAAKLQELGGNSDPSTHRKLVQEAQGIIAQYEAYVAGDAVLSQLDANPFTPISAQKTLNASLATLAKAVH